jgi:hypothetical protein
MNHKTLTFKYEYEYILSLPRDVLALAISYLEPNFKQYIIGTPYNLRKLITQNADWMSFIIRYANLNKNLICEIEKYIWPTRIAHFFDRTGLNISINVAIYYGLTDLMVDLYENKIDTLQQSALIT